MSGPGWRNIPEEKRWGPHGDGDPRTESGGRVQFDAIRFAHERAKREGKRMATYADHSAPDAWGCSRYFVRSEAEGKPTPAADLIGWVNPDGTSTVEPVTTETRPEKPRDVVTVTSRGWYWLHDGRAASSVSGASLGTDAWEARARLECPAGAVYRKLEDADNPTIL